MQEGLRGLPFSNEKTKFLINKQINPIALGKSFSEKELLSIFKKFTRNITLVPASDICRAKLGTDVVSGIYLISLAVSKKLIPLKSVSVLKAIKKIIPEKYLELNLKTFNLTSNSEALK